FGFIGALALFYMCLLLLSILTRGAQSTDPIRRLMRLQLGIVDRWPGLIKGLLPIPVAVLLWFCLAPLLTYAQLLPSSPSARYRIEQALLMGLSAYVTWKYLIGA